jgi:glucoamylase
MPKSNLAKQPTLISPSEATAPGAPGILARWTSSAKIGVGTALSQKSRVWFTLSHGIVNEIYFPSIDRACIRDMGFIVTDGETFFSEEKTDCASAVSWLAAGVPAFELVNTCRAGRYTIQKQIVTDPQRDSVLQQVQFTALKGSLSTYRLHILLAPHLNNQGDDNTAWIGEFAGVPILFAQRQGHALALACSVPWLKRSAGFVGSSDGWQDLHAHKRMDWEYTRAENGNVALTGEIDLLTSKGKFLLSLGFGANPDEAAGNAIASIHDGFEVASQTYIGGWQNWMKTHPSPDAEGMVAGDLSAISLAVLRCHESKTPPGALIASLSIPWGFSKGDDDIGGYHLVWPRDMVETAGALLAAGAHEDLRRILSYLQTTQLPDGHWPQNMWLDGSPHWDGIQMDETALPILLADLAYREKALTHAEVVSFWPMVRQAASYLVRNGPVSPEDRWEEDPGYTPFTVAAQIAALLAAADLAELSAEPSIAAYLRETADVWNDSIDRWMYASGTDWCRRFDVAGYYVRIAVGQTDAGDARFQGKVHVKNVAADDATIEAGHLVSPDALALVRFGLRAADDPRMGGTVKVIDALLKIETPTGPTWHRYNDDGYGEHADGAPFDGTGIGRGWPLLTGERAHFELARGRSDEAKRLLGTFESFANVGGLISEQVWDSADLPDHGLHFGRPSGSAMPLVWAHAEYLKLRRSLRDGKVFDLPPQTVQRYLVERTLSPRLIWRFNHKIRSVPVGKTLRVETRMTAVIHWSSDDWVTVQDAATHDTGIGIHLVDLPVAALTEGKSVVFTVYWPTTERWQGENFAVRIGYPKREECPSTKGTAPDAR